MPRAALPTLDHLWRASELGVAPSIVQPTGHAVLDAELPGGGWPAGQISEVLQAQPGLHEWRLLRPVLRATAARGMVVLVGSPHWPHMPALSAAGLGLADLLMVDTDVHQERLWAAEQALRCRDLAALLVWLPQARAEQLRRLQLASQAAHQPRPPLLFVFRPLDTQHATSPAPLRIGLRQATQAAPAGALESLPALEVQILKRRGPVREQPLLIHTAMPPVLAVLGKRRQQSWQNPKPIPVITPVTNPVTSSPPPVHVVDRPVPASVLPLSPERWHKHA
ncbi:translesion DNA synthesis-associated protein ImuA [Variovorax sp. HJSM1_2]|uniref:translesion DNA synthesis-associated protein ImuA n=1 Tax=Variovorax sp. HJSM1_2 TaxID=3366263 RepID=UPI003BC786D7